MQLKIQRSQRPNAWGAIVFCVDIRADYSPEERDNINKYRLGALLIYSSQAAQQHRENAKAQIARSGNGGWRDSTAGLARGMFSAALAKMALNVSIASLAKGHHIECKDLQELLEAEETLRNACKDLTQYLDVASTFDGSELIIDYDKGEERVQVAKATVPLIELPPPPAPAPVPPPRGAKPAKPPKPAPKPKVVPPKVDSSAHPWPDRKTDEVADEPKANGLWGLWLVRENKIMAWMAREDIKFSRFEVRFFFGGLAIGAVALLAWIL